LLLLKGGEDAQAAHFFEQALFFGSAQWDVYTLLGETYLRLGRFAAAERALQSARALFEASHAQHDAGALALGDIDAQLGEAYIRLSRFPEATQALQSALKLYEESTVQQDAEDRRHTMLTWARENVHRLEQGSTTGLLPHPLLTPDGPSAQ